MSKPAFLTILFSFMIVLSACTSLRRYRSAEGPFIDNDLATIGLFGIKLSPSAPGVPGKSLWDLSAESQSQFIRILNNRFPDNSLFFNSLNMKYMMGENELFSDDYTRSDMKLVFSVERNRENIVSSPADRLEYLKINLSIPDDSILRFTGWNNYSTEYGTIDIGSVSFTRSIDLTATAALSDKNGGITHDISTTGTASSSRKEDQKVGYRYLKLNGMINNRTISIEEEGTREIDLTGNISTDVSLAFNRFPLTIAVISGLKDSLGRTNESSGILVDYRIVAVPLMRNIKDTLYGIMEMDYLYRHVKKGSVTFPEWDDNVVYYKGKVRSKVPLFTSEEYLPSFYCIGCDGNRALLSSSRSGAPGNDLVFRSYRDAQDLFDWLRNRAISSKYSGKQIRLSTSDIITYEGRDLNASDFTGINPLKVQEYFRRDQKR